MEAKWRLRPAGPVDVNRHSGKTGGLCVCVCVCLCVCVSGGGGSQELPGTIICTLPNSSLGIRR